MPGDSNYSKKRKVSWYGLRCIFDRELTADQGGGKGGKWAPTKTSVIESGDVGVFVTCEMGKEKKCLQEAIDIFSQVI